MPGQKYDQLEEQKEDWNDEASVGTLNQYNDETCQQHDHYPERGRYWLEASRSTLLSRRSILEGVLLLIIAWLLWAKQLDQRQQRQQVTSDVSGFFPTCKLFVLLQPRLLFCLSPSAVDIDCSSGWLASFPMALLTQIFAGSFEENGHFQARSRLCPRGRTQILHQRNETKVVGSRTWFVGPSIPRSPQSNHSPTRLFLPS